MRRWFLPSFLLALLSALQLFGQANAKPESGVPILTGYTGVITNFVPGAQDVGPTFNPIFLVPLGSKFLLETEGEFTASLHHEDGVWHREYEKNLEYLQLNFFATPYLTVVGGRYLNPFGIFGERLHPMWIKNLQDTPLIFGLVPEAGNGGMLRGGIRLSPNVNFTYAGYFSATSTNPHMDATRLAGYRVAMFFPGARLEVGTSFQRILEGEHSNNVGFDFTWQAKPIPLDVRGEYAHSHENGSGYWIEGAYRLRQIRNPFFRRSQAVFRMEQFFTPPRTEGEMSTDAEAGGMAGMDEIPAINTQRFMAGWNYYFNDATKFSFAYGRAFTAEGNNNIFSLGIAYRFAIPLGGGKK